MGLDNFSSEKYRGRGGNWNSKNSYIDGGSVIRSEEGAICAVKDVKEIIGEFPTVSQFKSNREKIGTTTSPETFKDITGLTFNQIKKKAGAEQSYLDSEEYREWKIYRDFIIAANKYGVSFTAEQFRSDEECTSITFAKRVTGLKFNEIKKKLELVPNRDDSSKTSSTENKYSNKINEQLSNIDYKESSESYVYILRCKRIEDEEIYFYVGSCQDDRLKKRIKQHMKVGGHFSGPSIKQGKEMILPWHSVNWSIEIFDIIGTDIKNKKVLRHKENKIRNQVVIEHETVNVIGGN